MDRLRYYRYIVEAISSQDKRARPYPGRHSCTCGRDMAWVNYCIVMTMTATGTHLVLGSMIELGVTAYDHVGPHAEASIFTK